MLIKCRKLVGHFKHSPANAAELQQEQVQTRQDPVALIQDVPIGWNSTLNMITWLQSNKDTLRAALDLHQQRSTQPF